MTDDELISEYKKLDTASISDALDKLRLPGSEIGIAPLFDKARLVGRAFTVKFIPKGASNQTSGDYLDDVPPGSVIVIDNDDRVDCTVWGDIMTKFSISKGIAGTVIAGVCRDTALAIDLQYPIFSCGRFMRTGKDRLELYAVNKPVNVGGVQVNPGDLVIGNSDGVVFVPQMAERQVLEAAQTIENTEQSIIKEIELGKGLKEAREVHGYHRLQTPEDQIAKSQQLSDQVIMAFGAISTP